MRTLEVDGHTVDVVEMVDDNEAWVVLAVDDAVTNAGAPLSTGANDDELRAAARLWAQRS